MPRTGLRSPASAPWCSPPPRPGRPCPGSSLLGHDDALVGGVRRDRVVTNGSDPPRRLAPDIAERLAPGHYILVGSSRNRLAVELDRARLADEVQRQANAGQNMEAGRI